MIEIGTAREIITPELGGYLYGYGSKEPSTSIHDDLTVTAISVESGNTKFILMSLTVLYLNNQLSDSLREHCGAAAGVPASNVIVSCVHTHSGPVISTDSDRYYEDTGIPKVGADYFDKILLPKCVEAARACVTDMKPVKMGIATCNSMVGINRREILSDDKVILGQNPWGPYDSEMTVISFKDEHGKPIANIVHCTSHCTGAGIITAITRDWCGFMIDRLESETGAMTAFFNGCCGDINPRVALGLSVRTPQRRNIKFAAEVGSLAALEAMQAYMDIREYNDADAALVTGEIRIPFMPIMPLEEARQKYAEVEHGTARWDGPTRIKLSKIIAMHESGNTGPDDFIFKQTIVRIGPVVLIPLPFEAFTEIGLRLRKYSGFGYTLVTGCSNGGNSYLPTRDQLCRGGYEVDRFYGSTMPRQLPDDTDSQLIRANLNLLEGLRR